jgi:hypothetical protein
MTDFEVSSKRLHASTIEKGAGADPTKHDSPIFTHICNFLHICEK